MMNDRKIYWRVFISLSCNFGYQRSMFHACMVNLFLDNSMKCEQKCQNIILHCTFVGNRSVRFRFLFSKVCSLNTLTIRCNCQTIAMNGVYLYVFIWLQLSCVKVYSRHISCSGYDFRTLNGQCLARVYSLAFYTGKSFQLIIP